MATAPARLPEASRPVTDSFRIDLTGPGAVALEAVQRRLDQDPPHQPHQRHQHQQTREDGQDAVVRQRRGPVGHVVVVELRRGLLRAAPQRPGSTGTGIRPGLGTRRPGSTGRGPRALIVHIPPIPSVAKSTPRRGPLRSRWGPVRARPGQSPVARRTATAPARSTAAGRWRRWRPAARPRRGSRPSRGARRCGAGASSSPATPRHTCLNNAPASRPAAAPAANPRGL